MTNIRVLNTTEAAKALGLTVPVMRGMRNLGIGPDYVKMFVGRESGTPAIGYQESGLIDWINAQKVKPKDELRRKWLGDTGPGDQICGGTEVDSE